jgi:ribosomal protein S18 acetylase RimI-like enzyme
MAMPSFIYRQASLQDLWHETHSDSPMPAELGQYTNWQCIFEAQVIGHCTGNCGTGEIVGLAVATMHRRHGIGKKLLSLVVETIRAAGTTKIWLAAPSDPALPAFGFYRAIGWAPTGDRTDGGEEILEPRHN